MGHLIFPYLAPCLVSDPPTPWLLYNFPGIMSWNSRAVRSIHTFVNELSLISAKWLDSLGQIAGRSLCSHPMCTVQVQGSCSRWLIKKKTAKATRLRVRSVTCCQSVELTGLLELFHRLVLLSGFARRLPSGAGHRHQALSPA